MSAHERPTATVESLVAEVRVLMIGNRQVTMSMFKQLDWVNLDAIEPFGRVNLPPVSPSRYNPDPDDTVIHVVGRSKHDGALARSSRAEPKDWYYENEPEKLRRLDAEYASLRKLPLIVLAGLR